MTTDELATASAALAGTYDTTEGLPSALYRLARPTRRACPPRDDGRPTRTKACLTNTEAGESS